MQRLVPVAVALPSSVTAIAVATGTDHSLLLTANGKVLSFGRNTFGQLGDGSAVPIRSTPVECSVGRGNRAVQAGAHHSLVIKVDGKILGQPRATDPPHCGNH
jgi:alpha-tubulin suppressor-like RCC1 family protein